MVNWAMVITYGSIVLGATIGYLLAKGLKKKNDKQNI